MHSKIAVFTGSCSDLDTYSVYPGSDPPPMVQQQELQPLVPCSSTSSDMGGRLSSLDISYKLEEQYDPDGNDHTADTKYICLYLHMHVDHQYVLALSSWGSIVFLPC